MILLDTQSLVFMVSSPDKLSGKARKLINNEIDKGLIFISSISIWEIYLLVQKDRLRLTMDTDNWLEEVEKLPYLQFIPVDNRIAAKSVNLPGKFHSDPADRIIVATAREKGATLITSDEKIRKYQHVQSVW